jgi:DNA polymerase I
MPQPKFYIIDGNAYIHRAYHALPPLTDSKGRMINAVYGFTRMLLKILRQETPDYIAVCFDSPQPTFRHQEFTAYKATRKETDIELKEQFPLTRQIVEAFNIASFEKGGFEADDLIATLVEKAKGQGMDTVIVTGDKDVLQLVNDSVKVLNEPKGILYDEEKVKEKFGVGPAQVTDVMGLAGDTSDNVPGVPGIGEKTAIKLIQRFGSMEKLLGNVGEVEGKLKDKIKEFSEQAKLSKRLVTLVKDVPLDKKIADCRLKDFDRDKMLNIFNELGFKALIGQLITKTDAGDASYKTVLTRPDLEKLIKKLSECQAFALDLETTSTHPMQARIVGISVSCEDSAAFYIPVGHSYLGMPEQLPQEYVLEQFRPLLENDKIKKYGQNIKYDLIILKHHGIELEGVYFDTMVASYVLNPSKFNHNLEDIALEYLTYKMISISELIGKGAKQITMDKVEIEKVAPYACADADIVFRLEKILDKQMRDKDLEELFFKVEMPLVKILAEMEMAGIKVDVKYLKELSREFLAKIKELEEKIYQEAGQQFNVNSPKQLAFILFEKLGLPPLGKTKTGYSTQESVLVQLAAAHKLPSLILEYRELQKLQSTYVDSLQELMDQDTHRVHTSFNQTVTATGRLSSSEPNLQNIPIRTELGRKIRRAFIPEEGFKFVSADYSQIDLRALAHASGDKNLSEAFNNNEDVHNRTASEIFSVPIDKVTEEMRKIAKTVNFGLSYGMSAFGLSRDLGIDINSAQDYIDKYFEQYHGIKEYMEKTIEQARRDGYVTTLLNRRRYLPEINSKNGSMKNFAERTAINTPIQGTSADIIKVAMIKVQEKLKNTNSKTRMLLQIHDELIFEVPEGEVDIIKAMAKKEMEEAVKLNIPVVVDVNSGDNWRDLE